MIEPDQTKSEKRYWQKPENYVALATLLLLFTYTGAQLWQTHLISGNNIVSQRALVWVDFPNLAMGPDIKDQTKTIVSFQIPLTNSGNTATKNLKFLFRCAPSAEELPEPWVLLYRGDVERVPQFIAPHQTTKSLCTFTRPQLEEVKAGNSHAYVMGDITYFDRLDPILRIELSLIGKWSTSISSHLKWSRIRPSYWFLNRSRCS